MSPTGGVRHEHRHPGCGRSRLEARGCAARLGRQRRCCARTRSSAGRSRVRNVTDASSQSRAHARHPPAPAAAGHLPAGPAGDAARKDYGRLVHRDDAARVVHASAIHLGYRYDDLADRLRRRHAGAAARRPRPISRPRVPAPARRMPGCPTAARSLDLFGRGFVLLRLGRDAPDAESMRLAASQARRAARSDRPRRARRDATLYQRRLVLVRPDGHVAWRATTRSRARCRARVIDRVCVARVELR